MLDKAKQIVQFMDTVEKLCYIKRFATLKDNNRERDSDHIMKLSFLVLLVADFLSDRLNKTKLFELALVHDLAEADAGDVSYIEQFENNEAVEHKRVKELNVIKSYQKLLPSPLNDKIYELFMEYETGCTIESKIIHSLDKLGGDLQCCKDLNLSTYCNHNAFISRISALQKHKYSTMTNEPIIEALERLILEKSKDTSN